MKTKLIALLFAIVASVGLVCADTVKIGDLYYDLNSRTSTASVTYQLLDGDAGDIYNYSGLTTAVIPSSVTYGGVVYTVTGIGNDAFQNCSQLTSVTIPETVTLISGGAFEGCSGLTTLEFQNVMRFGEHALKGCTGLVSITLGSGCSAYPYLSDCINLVSVNAASDNMSFVSIDGVLYNKDQTCLMILPRAKTGICNIPGSVDQIRYIEGNSLTAFNVDPSAEHFSSIDGVLFTKDQTELICYPGYKQGAYSIPNGVNKIFSGAFYGCSGLTAVTIPASVTRIEEKSFGGCGNLASIVVDPENSTYDSRDNCNAIIRTSSNTLEAGCRTTTIPATVTQIDSYAFYECLNLTSLVIPNSVTKIGESCFTNCSDLVQITIGSGVTSFSDIGFPGCNSLTAIHVASDNTRYAEINGVLFNKEQTTLIAYPLGKQGAYTIPDGVQRINYGAFSACTKLTSVTIPASLTRMNDEAFWGCVGLTAVKISDMAAWCAMRIDEYTANPLYYAKNLYLNGKLITELVIPDEVTIIEDNIFTGYDKLTYLEIPDSVKRIEDAFTYCTNLKTIYSKAAVPPTLYSQTFEDIDSSAVVYVPNKVLNDYKNASGWKEMNIQSTVLVDSETASTSATITLTNMPWAWRNNPIVSVAIEGGEAYDGNILEYTGLEPDSTYENIPVVLTAKTGETDTVVISFTTTALSLTTQPSQPVSSNTAILLAQTNMADAEVSCGFEWKRNDAPDDMAGTKVYTPVANGTMAGRLKGLKDDVYYKYRAFYQSQAGNMHYGDWQYIFTGDMTVEFDPVLYTYEAVSVKEDAATLRGYALAGSSDFTEQGFEYWAESRVPHADGAPRRMPAALGEHHTIQATGISMRVTVTDLDAGTVYKYRTYAKIGNEMIYGSEMSFTTKGEYAGTEGMEVIIGTSNPRAHKLFQNGQILILRGDNTYSITGQRIK